MIHHGFFKSPDLTCKQLVVRQKFGSDLWFDRCCGWRHHSVNKLTHRFAHTSSRNAVFGIEGKLLGPASLRFINGTSHGIGNLVSIKDGLAVEISRSATNGLDQTALRAQKPFLVGIQNGNQRRSEERRVGKE